MTPVGSLEGVCLSLIAGFPVPLKALHLGCAASEETFGLMLSDRRVKPTASSSCRILIVLTQISKQDRFPPYWWWMDYSPLAAIYSMLPSIYSMVKVTLNFALESFHWNIMYRKNPMYRTVLNMLTGRLLIVMFTPLKERLTFLFNLCLCWSY